MPDFNESKTSIDDDSSSLDQDKTKYLRIYLKGYTAVVNLYIQNKLSYQQLFIHLINN